MSILLICYTRSTLSLVLILDYDLFPDVERKEPSPRKRRLLCNLYFHIIGAPFAGHDLTNTLPPRPIGLIQIHVQLAHHLRPLTLRQALGLLHRPPELEPINGRRVLNYATYLVVKHHHHENAEQKGEDQGQNCNEQLRCLCKQEAIRVVAVVALPRDQDEGMRTACEDVDEEQEEVLLIVVTDAIVHPGTVVVHAGDAALAGRAVVALRDLDGVALLAATGKD
jgi:hypothetical protein